MKNTVRKSKYITKLLCVLSAASMLISQTAFAGEVIPLPGIKDEEAEMITVEEDGTNISYTDEDGNIFTPHVELVKSSSGSYPSSFDLRNVNGRSYVTRPECQYCADCWTYASISSLESNAMMQGFGEQHFSKSHLCYFSLTPKTEGTKSDSPFSTGGNTNYVISTLSNLEGLANKSDFPNAQSTDVTYPESARYNRESGYILDEAVTISDTDEMKDWLMNNGALYASIYQLNYSGNIPEYMYSTPETTNHGITIIGWDDSVAASNFTHTETLTYSDGSTETITATPSQDGAWIVKNSVGYTYNGEKQEYYDNNYMYLSYDQYIGSCTGFKVQKDPEVLSNYTYTERSTNKYYYGTAIQYANVFTADYNEKINQVCFKIDDYNIKYPSNKITDVTVTVKIYKNLSSSYENSGSYFQTSAGTLAGTFTGHYYQTGCYTFDIPSDITVSKGERYSVVISMTDSDGCYLDIPVEYGDEYTSATGQSFFTTSSDGTMRDTTASGGVGNIFMHVYTTCNHTEATRTVSGTAEKYCTQCGKTLETLCSHTYDSGTVTTAATCSQEGEIVYTCTKCGETKTEILSKLSHTVVTDKGYAATCTTAGLTDGTHCSVCKQVLTAQTVIKVTGHTNAAAVKENVAAATCTKAGSYDSVVYCSVCKEEISRSTVTVPAAGHTNAAAVKENSVAATCTRAGSYDSVVYCSVCREEISRSTVTVPAAGHTQYVSKAGTPATCTTAGTTDEIKCSVCGATVQSQTVIPAKGHTSASAVKENVVVATCTTAGSYDSVVYCSVCNKEISRTKVTVPATGHTNAAAVKENSVAATCTTAGSYDSVVYCSVCNKEISRTKVTVPATGHKFSYVYNNDATTVKDGTETQVCSVCGVRGDTRTASGTMINPTSNAVINARGGSVDYRTKVTLMATASNVPSGYYLAIYEGDIQKVRGDNESVSFVIGEMKSSATYTVRVVNGSNETQKDASGSKLQKDVTITVNANFFIKIVAFFRSLFGSLPSKTIRP